MAATDFCTETEKLPSTIMNKQSHLSVTHEHQDRAGKGPKGSRLREEGVQPERKGDRALAKDAVVDAGLVGASADCVGSVVDVRLAGANSDRGRMAVEVGLVGAGSSHKRGETIKDLFLRIRCSLRVGQILKGSHKCPRLFCEFAVHCYLWDLVW